MSKLMDEVNRKPSAREEAILTLAHELKRMSAWRSMQINGLEIGVGVHFSTGLDATGRCISSMKADLWVELIGPALEELEPKVMAWLENEYEEEAP